MPFPPELDMLDQLQGGPFALRVIVGIFSSPVHAQRATDGLVVVRDQEAQSIELWEWDRLCRAQPEEWAVSIANMTIALTDKGARMA